MTGRMLDFYNMKPTVRSTSIAFLVVGVAMLVFGHLGILHVAAFAAGVGLYLRLRYAWWLGVAYAAASALVTAAWTVIAILTGKGSISVGYLALPAATVAADLYLLGSLMFVRGQLFQHKK